jgi:hypothetical protein
MAHTDDSIAAQAWDASAPQATPTLSGSHRRTLEAIFRHPLAHNLDWRELVALIAHIGQVEERSGDDCLFTVGAEHQFVRRPHHAKDMAAPEVMAVRHLLARAGWSASGAPIAAAAPAPPPALIAVIDRNEAQIWRIDLSVKADGSEPAVEAYDPRHVLHHMVQKTHRLGHGKTSADDRLFLEAIASPLATGGKIVIIGHGVGESNIAGQVTAYLKIHHKETYGRIVEEIVADLPGLSTAQRLDLGRHALEDPQNRSS